MLAASGGIFPFQRQTIRRLSLLAHSVAQLGRPWGAAVPVAFPPTFGTRLIPACSSHHGKYLRASRHDLVLRVRGITADAAATACTQAFNPEPLVVAVCLARSVPAMAAL